jgi:hypothetical protein
MTSRFAVLADLIRSPKDTADADRPKTAAQRERERAELREDMAWGRGQARKQAEESDPEAAYLAHCKRQALAILQAGARARGLPVPTRLVQEEEPSDEYHDEPGPGDDRPHPKDKKGRRKAKPKPVDEGDKDSNEDDEDANQGDEDDQGETEAQYWARVDQTAKAIIAAGRRRRGEIP